MARRIGIAFVAFFAGIILALIPAKILQIFLGPGNLLLGIYFVLVAIFSYPAYRLFSRESASRAKGEPQRFDVVPLPLPGPAQFNIEEVFSVPHVGCVVGGTVLAGIIRVPCKMRLEPADHPSAPPQWVDVVRLVVGPEDDSEAGAGAKVLLTLRGVRLASLRTRERWSQSRERKWGIRAGDQLVA